MTNQCPTTPYSNQNKPYSDKPVVYTKKENPYTENNIHYSNKENPYSENHFCPVGFLQLSNGGYLKLGSGGRIIITA